jgi:hypothetical protein
VLSGRSLLSMSPGVLVKNRDWGNFSGADRLWNGSNPFFPSQPWEEPGRPLWSNVSTFASNAEC